MLNGFLHSFTRSLATRESDSQLGRQCLATCTHRPSYESLQGCHDLAPRRRMSNLTLMWLPQKRSDCIEQPGCYTENPVAKQRGDRLGGVRIDLHLFEITARPDLPSCSPQLSTSKGRCTRGPLDIHLPACCATPSRMIQRERCGMRT